LYIAIIRFACRHSARAARLSAHGNNSNGRRPKVHQHPLVHGYPLMPPMAPLRCSERGGVVVCAAATPQSREGMARCQASGSVCEIAHGGLRRGEAARRERPRQTRPR
jgi:hypothetical protein